VSAVDRLLEIVEANRRGESLGLPSVCSADPFVLEAAATQAARDGTVVCIESTCNQVNQFGGYTGMNPADFRGWVASVADRTGLERGRVILGGDHLGPYVWRREPAAQAMEKARDLVRHCVLAGYTKIHFDASMACADDPAGPLDEEVATERTVDLCLAAEYARASLPEGASAPVYVIGTEVPIPGGETAESGAPGVTAVEDLSRALELALDGFQHGGLSEAWERVIAVVVQPGVEFGDAVVYDYGRERAKELSAFVKGLPHLIFEAHSTDYQSAEALRAMVRDHFAILKVGPGLTFSMREALFALDAIERELLAGRTEAEPSRLREVLEATMLANPEHWRRYISGDEGDQRLARAFGYSDRSRYYWHRPELQAAIGRLLDNLWERGIPPTLLSQYLPEQYEAMRGGSLEPNPEDLIRHKVLRTLDRYAAACGMRSEADGAGLRRRVP
jgi:D-tagatose-1,6-bisphosphate aldolase subunit GatZ/KbaZ